MGHELSREGESSRESAGQSGTSADQQRGVQSTQTQQTQRQATTSLAAVLAREFSRAASDFALLSQESSQEESSVQGEDEDAGGEPQLLAQEAVVAQSSLTYWRKEEEGVHQPAPVGVASNVFPGQPAADVADPGGARSYQEKLEAGGREMVYYSATTDHAVEGAPQQQRALRTFSPGTRAFRLQEQQREGLETVHFSGDMVPDDDLRRYGSRIVRNARLDAENNNNNGKTADSE